MGKIIRQPVVVVLGHVDSGKTLLLDKIRGTIVQSREDGGITQHIGASFFPSETLRKICGSLISGMQSEVSIPGLLVIDTPGHEVFANLRNRGGSAADISVLVVDCVRGFEVQTYESLEILKSRHVPFVVALNKVDLISGWRSSPKLTLSDSISKQEHSVERSLDEQIYTVVGELSRLGFASEFVSRVRDFAKEIAIVPISAKTGEGIPELMTVLIGLTQQYLTKKLVVTEGPARGIVLEMKEELGLGQTADVILLDGVLKDGEMIAMGKRDGPISTKIRAIFLPKPLDEMRDPRDRFTAVDTVHAAAGVKIAAPEIEGVLAGSPFLSIPQGFDKAESLEQIAREIESVFIEVDTLGVVIKADTLGSLEALIAILKHNSVPIRLADIGRVSKRDVVEAVMVADKDPYLGAIISFRSNILPDAEDYLKTTNVKFFSDPIIYNLVDNYLAWVQEEKEAVARNDLISLMLPSKFQALKGYVFRRRDPAIFGVEILAGKMKQKATVMNDQGVIIGTVHGIQDDGKTVNEAIAGMQVALSMNEPTIGRHVSEGDYLYTLPSSEVAKILQERYGVMLEDLGLDILNEVIEVRRKKVDLYGF